MTFLLLLFVLFIMVDCYHHDEINYLYVCPLKSGTYTGTFKNYGKVNGIIYSDTSFQTDVSVKINENDTIDIYGLYIGKWKFRCNLPTSPQGGEWWRDGDVYINYRTSFNFIRPDSLRFYTIITGGGFLKVN